MQLQVDSADTCSFLVYNRWGQELTYKVADTVLTQGQHIFLFEVDTSMQTGVYYYVCTVGNITNKGQLIRVKSTGLDEVSALKPTIASNPTTGIILLKSVENGEQVEVVSLTGKIVKQTSVQESAISIVDLANGNYIIRFPENKKLQSIRVVKE